MKHIFLYIFCLIFLVFKTLNIYAQSEKHLYEDILPLEKQEILNDIFKDARGGHDFRKMKVAFFSSPGGTVQRFNEHYFEVLEFNDLNTQHALGTLIFFTPAEKEKHGYDVAIVYVSKNNQPRLNKKLIRTKKDFLKQQKSTHKIK